VTAADRRVREVLSELEGLGVKKLRDAMKDRYGILAKKAWGVPMNAVQRLAKRLGRDHDLALALWETGWFEARILCAFVDDPALVTPAQMDRWAASFENWGECDTICFALFDRSPHAWKKVAPWSRRREEYVKRAAFALIASLALHDKRADDAKFARCLPLIERAATDERNFVKKGVSWALRVVGRRNAALNAAAIETSRRLAASEDPTARWIGRTALKELTGAVVRRALARRAAKA
jgi:3-methyladenine DNA glycosylase AlkD